MVDFLNLTSKQVGKKRKRSYSYGPDFSQILRSKIRVRFAFDCLYSNSQPSKRLFPYGRSVPSTLDYRSHWPNERK